MDIVDRWQNHHHNCILKMSYLEVDVSAFCTCFPKNPNLIKQFWVKKQIINSFGTVAAKVG